MIEMSKAFGQIKIEDFNEKTWKAYNATCANLAKLAADEAAKLAD